MSNETKQTAVEWYAQRLYDLEMAYNQGVINTDTYIKGKREAVEQAKEMEKEQHGTTWDKSMDNLDVRGGNIVRAWEDFDDYYKQTYGGNK